MLPHGFGLMRQLFPPSEMGKVWGCFGPVMGLSAGPIVGGTLVDVDLLGSGWRSIFLVNLPIGVAALAVAARYIPADRTDARGARLDLPGVALAGIGTFMLVYPLVQGRELGWPAWVCMMLAGSLPVLAPFAAHQLRRKRAGATPLVEPGIIARRPYVSGVAFALLFFAAMGLSHHRRSDEMSAELLHHFWDLTCGSSSAAQQPGPRSRAAIPPHSRTCAVHRDRSLPLKRPETQNSST